MRTIVVMETGAKLCPPPVLNPFFRSHKRHSRHAIAYGTIDDITLSPPRIGCDAVMPLYLKYLITAAIVVAVSEIARHNDRAGAFIASLPLVSLLVMFWLHMDSQPAEKIASHAWYSFWYVIPTLPMFILFPLMINRWGFWLAMVAAITLTIVCFVLFAQFVRLFGVNLL